MTFPTFDREREREVGGFLLGSAGSLVEVLGLGGLVTGTRDRLRFDLGGVDEGMIVGDVHSHPAGGGMPSPPSMRSALGMGAYVGVIAAQCRGGAEFAVFVVRASTVDMDVAEPARI